MWNEGSDTPESDFETSDSGNGVHVNASDSSSPETETTSQRLSSPPVVTQTRPKGGCQTAMPRRKRRRRSVRTTESATAMDTRQESVAPSTLDSERIHKKSECIMKGEPILETASPASHGMAQPQCSDCSRTDPLPSGSGHLSPAGHDAPAERRPAGMNICNTPDNLQIEMSVMSLKMAIAPSTLDSERIHKKSECITKGEPILETASPAGHGMAQPQCSDCSRTDPLPSGSGHLSPAGHDTLAERRPAGMNICNTNLQIEMSVMSLKMADGSPPAEVKILTDSDILQKELSVMTVTSERWMERFVMNPQVLCLDGLTPDYDPEDRCSDVDGEDGVFQDMIPEVVSVRPEVT